MSEQDMVELVARAICRAWLQRTAEQEYAAGKLGGDASAVVAAVASGTAKHWREFEPEARAAISALRDPTDAMVLAGTKEILALEDPDVDNEAEAIWHCMIDTALKRGA